MTRKTKAVLLARRLYEDDLGRADEVPIEPDGGKAYDGWLRSATEACDFETARDLDAVDRDEFAAEWERLQS